MIDVGLAREDKYVKKTRLCRVVDAAFDIDRLRLQSDSNVTIHTTIAHTATRPNHAYARGALEPACSGYFPQ
jgi:hypothetical protein